MKNRKSIPSWPFGTSAHDDVVLAAPLRLVQGGIGRCDEVELGDALVRAGGHAEARGDALHRGSGEHDLALGDGSSEALGELGGTLAASLRQQHREFLAA